MASASPSWLSLVLRVLVGRVGQVVAHLQVPDDRAGDAGEGVLVLDRCRSAGRGRRPPWPRSRRDAVDQRLAPPSGGGVAGQPLADHQADDVGHRRGGRVDRSGSAPCVSTAWSQTAARLARTPPARWRRSPRCAPARARRRPAAPSIDFGPQRARASPRRGGRRAAPSGRPGRGCAWSPCPTGRAADAAARRDGRSGCGPSPENTTSRSGCSASERAAWLSARLKMSVGLSCFPLM